MRTRADQAHLASEDIPQLRQFINTAFSQPPADARDTRVIGNFKPRTVIPFILLAQLGFQCMGIADHRTEFIEGEAPLTLTNAVQSDKDRSGRINLNEPSQQRPGKSQDDEADTRAHNVNGSFDNSAP